MQVHDISVGYKGDAYFNTIDYTGLNSKNVTQYKSHYFHFLTIMKMKVSLFHAFVPIQEIIFILVFIIAKVPTQFQLIFFGRVTVV